MVDCPQRERMGYGGDAHATTHMALANYDMGAFYTKWAEDWRDVQGADGSIPYTAPTYWGGGGPIWSGFVAHLPWEMFRRYGDYQILERQYPAIKRWLDSLEPHVKDDMLVRWGGEWDFLGDWLWPGVDGNPNGDTPEALFLNNAYRVYALRLAAQISSLTGHSDAETWNSRADHAAKAIHAKFFRAATNDYADGDQTYLAAALLAAIPPTGVRDQVWKRLEEEILVHRQGHIHTGITGGGLLTRLLLDANRGDLLYAMVSKTDWPSWADFLAKGQTTFPEQWNLKESWLHSSYEYVGSWFTEGILGLKVSKSWSPTGDEVGLIDLRPLLHAVPRLEHAAGSLRVPGGLVAVAWDLEPDSSWLRVTLPPVGVALLHIPVVCPTDILLDGKVVQSSTESDERSGEMVRIITDAGTYNYEIRPRHR